LTVLAETVIPSTLFYDIGYLCFGMEYELGQGASEIVNPVRLHA